MALKLSRSQKSFALQEVRRNIARAQANTRDFFNRIDMTEFTARQQESDMILLLAGWAKDPSLDIDVRFRAAVEVLDRARGSVQPKLIMQDLDTGAEDSAGKTVEIHIDEARQAAERMMEANKIVGTVPPEKWPDWLKAEYGPAEMAIWENPKLAIDEGDS